MMDMRVTPERERSPRGATIRWTHRPDRPRAVVLVLHGGRERGTQRTSGRQLAVLRVIPFAKAVARRGGDDVAVVRLRYAVRGWNSDAGPVRDTQWALGHIAEQYPDLPVGLMGYSMGGRAALRLAAEPQVRSVVTLAAWVDRRDITGWRVNPGLPVLLLHGRDDRVTSPAGSELAAGRLTDLGARVDLDVQPGDGHAMLRHARHWHRRAADHLVGTLLEGAG